MTKTLGLINESNVQHTEEETARQIITRAFGRAVNREVESGIYLEPGKELMSSERICELGITKKNFVESFLQDPQVVSVDCVEGEFLLTTTEGTINFRLVFGDEAREGKS